MAATTLRVGDVAIIGVNTEDTIPGGSSPNDLISFILLAPVGKDTQIFFTDRNWNGSTFGAAGGGEGTYTYKAASDLPAGTVVTISQSDLTTAGMALADTGETIYVYQGTDADTPTKFLHAVDIADGTATFDGNELLNTGLVSATSAVSFSVDNAEFGTRTHNIQTPDLFAQINNATDWVQNDNSPQDGTKTGTPAFTAPDSQIWVAGSGAGEAIVTINLDATYTSSGNPLAYQIVQAFQNDAALFHPSDITLDTVEGKAFFVDADLAGHNRIIQLNISTLLNNPGVALADPANYTVLYSNSSSGATNSMRTLSVDTVNNIIYFDIGTTFNKIVYNTANQTPTQLANLNTIGNGTNNYITQVAIDYTTGQVLLGSSRITSTFGSDVVTKNFVYTATGLTSSSSSLSFSILPFNPDDDDVGGINNPNLTSSGQTIIGEAWPMERGTIRGIDIDQVNHIAYIVTGSVELDTSAAGDGSQFTTYYGGIYSYALTGNASGNVTTLFTQDGSTGPVGLLYYIEVDPATNKYYVIDETGTNADPGDGGVWMGNLAGGTPVFLATVGNFNGLGPQGLEIQHAPTLTGFALTTVFHETPGNPSPNNTPITVANNFQSTDADSGTAAHDQLAGAQVRISANYQTGTGHNDQLLWGGTVASGTDQNGTLSIGGDTITYSWNATLGVLTFTGITTLDNYETILGQVKFRADGDNPTVYDGVLTRTVSYSTFDGLLYSDEVSVIVSIIGDNDAPTIAGIPGSAVDVVEDAAYTVTGVSIADVDADPANDTMTVTLSTSNGSLHINTAVANGIATGQISGNDVSSIVVNATLDEINATLAGSGVVRNNTPDYNGASAISIKVEDNGQNGGGGNQAVTKSITLNITPDADITADSRTVAEDSGANEFKGASSLLGNDTFEDTGRYISAVGTAAHGTVSINNNGTAGDKTDDYVVYTPDANYNGTDSFTYTVTSPASSTTEQATVSLTVTAVNDPVTGTVPATLTLLEDAAATAVTGMSIADVDATLAPAGVYDVTLSAGHGKLTLTTLAGLTFTTGDGTTDASMKFHGTLAAINTALGTAKYAPDANYFGSDTITLAVTDTFGGVVATGTGIATSDSDDIAVTVTGVNDEPTLTATGLNPTFTEDGAAVDLFSTVTASTVETGQTFTSMTLTVSNVTDDSHEILRVDSTDILLSDGFSDTTGVNGLTVNVSVVAGLATVSFTGATLSAAALQTLVDGLSYRNTSQLPTDANRVVTITQLVDSGANTPPDDAVATLNVASTVNVDPVNDTPVVNLAATNTSTEQVFAKIDATATITDADLATRNGGLGDYAGSTLTVVRQGGANADDTFAFDFTGTTLSLVGGSLQAGGLAIGTVTNSAGTLTIAFTSSATTATSALVQDALRAIQYANNNDTPDPTVNLTVSLDDGAPSNAGQGSVSGHPAVGSDTIQLSITDTPENQPPLGQDKTVSATEDTTYTFTAADFNTGYSDTENDAFAGTVLSTLPSAAQGVLYYDADGPGGAAPVAASKNAFISLAHLTAGDLTFVPAADFNGPATFTFAVKDAAGSTDTTPNTMTLNVAAVNDAPVNANNGPVPANEDIATVIGGIAISDDDTPGSTYTVLLTVQHGTLNVSLKGATTLIGGGQGTNGLTLTGTLADLNATLANPNLTYKGDLNFNGADSLTISSWEGVPSDATSFAAAATTGTSTGPVGLATADVNGDGKLDLIYATDSNGGTAGGSPSVVVRLGDGNGGFGSETPYTIGNQPNEVIAADLNGDGKADIIAAGYNADTFPGSLEVLLNNGTGTFAAASSVSNLRSYYDVDVGDVDRDGDLDLIAVRRNFGLVEVFTNNGSGVFSSAATVDTRAPSGGTYVTTSAALADFNGDGDLDIVAVNQTDNSNSPSEIVVALGGAGATFNPATAIITQASGFTGAFEVATGDLNNDGNADIAFVNYTGTPRVTVLLGKGDGTFGTPVSTTLSGTPWGVDIADVNGDGIADLVVADTSAAGKVVILVNKGDGSFQTPVLLDPSGNGTDATVIGDFNGDGHADIVGINAGSSTFSVFKSTTTNLGDVDTRGITVAAVNDAPTVVGGTTQALTAINEDTPSSGGQTIDSLLATHYSDAADNQIPNGGASSPGAFSGVAVTANGSSAGTGQWQYFNGASWVNIGAASDAAAVLLSNTTAIRFNPALNYNGAAPTLTVHLIDNSLGFGIVNGDVKNITGLTGGTNAYSTGTVDLTQTINAVNDAPTVSFASGSGVAIWDQSALNLTNADNISQFIVANDFQLSQSTTLTNLTVFLDDNVFNDNGVIDSFGGTLSWAIFADASGGPGALIAQGSDNAPVLTDTGSNLSDGTDIVRAKIALGNVSLGSGTYWIGVHEGASISTASDGSIVWLVETANDQGATGKFAVAAASPGPWNVITPYAFTLTNSDYVATEQVPLSLKNLVTIADVDAGSGNMTVTLEVDYGVLTVTKGTSTANVTVNSATNVTVSGTLTQIADLLSTNATSTFTYTANTDNPPGSATLKVTVNDNGNTPAPAQTTIATHAITILAVNDAPSGADNTVTGSEDDPLVFATADFKFTDTAEGNAFKGVYIDSITGKGTLWLDTNGVAAGGTKTAVTGGTFLTAADIGAGNVYFQPVTDEFGNNYASFQFKVQDNGGTANGGTDTDQTANKMTINVEPDNLPPVVDLNGAGAGVNVALTYTENGSIGIGTGLTVSDPDTALGDFLTSATVTIVNAGASDKLSISGVLPTGITAGAVTKVGNDLQLTLTGNKSPTDYQTALGQVRYSSTSEEPTGEGATRTITVKVHDQLIDSATATATITVVDVNDAPSGTNATITINEDTARVLTVADFGFTDVDNDTLLAVRIDSVFGGAVYYDADGAGGAPPALATLGQFYSKADVTAGKLSFRPDLNLNGNGAAAINFSVQDNGGTANGGIDIAVTPNNLTVNITPVNDAPVGIEDFYSLPGDTKSTVTVVNGVLANDIDVDGDSLTAVLVPGSGPAHGSLTFNSNGSFTYTPVATYTGTDSFTYKASDGSLQSTTTTVFLDVLPNLHGLTENDDNAFFQDPAGVIIYGAGGNDWLVTWTGDDTIRGGAGNDTIFSGAGDDTITFLGDNEGFDTISGGAGNDRIIALGDNTVIGLVSVEGVEEFSANGFANVIIRGDASDNVFNFAGTTLTGIALIDGGAGNDKIIGSSAADKIAGGLGQDKLTGGGGNDTFIYTNVAESTSAAPDTITDFLKGSDKIDLSGIDANTIAGGDQAFSFIGNAGFSGVAGQLRSELSGDTATVYGDVNGDSQADFVLQVILQGSAPFTNLQSSNFIL